jgi:hypothetical protein
MKEKASFSRSKSYCAKDCIVSYKKYLYQQQHCSWVCFDGSWKVISVAASEKVGCCILHVYSISCFLQYKLTERSQYMCTMNASFLRQQDGSKSIADFCSGL